MARRAATMPLNVYQNGKLVGRFRRSGAVDFQYDPTWLVWDNASAAAACRASAHASSVIGRMSVDRDHSPLCEARLMNGAVCHWLRER
jgi:hypothetical protein